MEITIRNITKDNDVSINLPMETEKLTNLLGNDEWIIIDCPADCSYMGSYAELTDIMKLNEIVRLYHIVFIDEYADDMLQMLCKTYYLNEVENPCDVIIIDFDAETETWGCGNGVPFTDEWKGLLLFTLGLAALPFPYTSEMEDWINWEMLWNQAETEGWREVYYNGNHYIVHN